MPEEHKIDSSEDQVQIQTLQRRVIETKTRLGDLVARFEHYKASALHEVREAEEAFASYVKILGARFDIGDPAKGRWSFNADTMTFAKLSD